MRAWFDLIWPHLDEWSPTQLQKIEDDDNADLAVIQSTNWNPSNELALAEAKALFDAEKARRESAEIKASIYIGTITAIVPIIMPISVEFYAERFSKEPLSFQVVSFIFLFAGATYLLAAARWALGTFRVSVHARVDAVDYARIWKEKNRKSKLVAELFAAIRRNRHMVNRKVSCVKMSHEFVVRSLFSFFFLGLFVLGWKPAQAIWALCKAALDLK